MKADRWLRIRTILNQASEASPEDRQAARTDLNHLDRLEQLFRAASLLPDADRRSFLDAACADDPELRSELLALLEADEEADHQAFLDVDAADVPAFTPTASAERSASALPEGTQLGPYVVVRPLGRGGMGDVYLAKRETPFKRTVAIKVVRRGMDTEDVLERFHVERQILAALDHPNIARLIDGGAADDGRPYLVMEYVHGEPITDYCDRRRLTIEQRLRLMIEICDAVQYAHRSLIVHRDLKPSNILVSESGEEALLEQGSAAMHGHAKLLDFGIAKLLEADSDSGLTATGKRILTPGYASPEQVQGEPITTQSDVFSLGVLLYELLSGRHPFRDRGTPVHEVARRVLSHEPESLSSVVLRDTSAESPAPDAGAEAADLARDRGISLPRLQRLLRGDLDTIVRKAMRKEASRRYRSAEALADDLRRFLEGRPVLARPESAIYRARKFVGRHRISVATGALALIALIAATVFSIAQMQEAQRQRDTAIWESRRADAQVEFQRLLLSQIGDEPMTMRQILDNGRILLEREHAAEPRFLASILLELASNYAELGDIQQNSMLLARAESLATAGLNADLLPTIRCEVADNFRMQGRYEEAWQTLESTEPLLQPLAGTKGEVRCLAVRSHLADETGQYDESVRAARRGVAIKERLGEVRDMEYFRLLNNLAGGLDAVGRSREAVAIFEDVIAAMDASGRSGMLARTIMVHNLGLVLVRLGENATAEGIFRDVLERAHRSDPTGRILWQPTIHYAEAAFAQAHPDSALKYFDLIATQGTHETNLFWEGRGLFGKARAQVQLGLLDEARIALQRLEQILDTHPDVRRTDDVIPDANTLEGLLALAEGDTASARIQFRAALRANGFYEGRNLTRLRPVVILAAESALALGEVHEAMQLADEALSIAAVDSLTDARSAGVGEARLLQARAHLVAGDAATARTLAARALVALRYGAGLDHPRTQEAEAIVAALAGSNR